MSNPGVITLEAFDMQAKMPVRIEDNLGESVHIHIGPFRLDLTLDELKELACDAEVLLDNYLKPHGVSVANFDSEFLGQIGHMLIDLDSANFERVAISDMLVTLNRGHFRPKKVVGIGDSDVVQAIKSDYSGYQQTFGYDQNRAQLRIENAQDIAARGCYGATGEYIVLFNDQMFIRDGQHRAAALYVEDRLASVNVLRLKFRDGRHSIPRFQRFSSLMQLRMPHTKRIVWLLLCRVSHLKRRVVSKMNGIRNKRVNDGM